MVRMRRAMSIRAIILAAGKGTRMRSDVSKVLHPVSGKPMLSYVVDAVLGAGISDVVVVVGHQSDTVCEMFSDSRVSFVVQDQQLGTGHAVLVTEPVFDVQSCDSVLVLPGDCPLIESETIRLLMNHYVESESVASVLTTRMKEPANYGRIIRDTDDSLMGIVEAKDCTTEERQITEINAGVYVFQIQALFSALTQVSTDNQQGEYYLTDVIRLIRLKNLTVSAFCSFDSDSVLGVNSRKDLAQVSQVVYRRKIDSLMEQGVTFIDPKSSFIDPSVEIAHDTTIHPFTVIQGSSRIGKECTILPFVHLVDTVVPDGSTVKRTGEIVR